MGKILLIIGAIYHFAFAYYHTTFWKQFDWNTKLKKSGQINNAITRVMNLCLIYIFVIIGVMSLLFANDLLMMRLGKFILAAISGFWFIRSVEQIIYFKLEHHISRALFFVFLAGGIIYLLPIL